VIEEATYSRLYLYDLFKSLVESERKNIGLMGGWAIHFLLEGIGVKHIGSRDIDIFFNPEKISYERIVELVKSHKFEPHSTFRWVRIIRRSDGIELTLEESKSYPLFDLVYVYLDVAAPISSQKKIMPLKQLAKVFRSDPNWYRLEDIEILMPSVEVMVELKLYSSVGRIDDFKRAKDIADLFPLLHRFPKLWKMDAEGRRISLINEIEGKDKFKENIGEFMKLGSIKDAANMLGISSTTILSVLEKI